MAHFPIPERKNSRIVSGSLNILFRSDEAANQYNTMEAYLRAIVIFEQNDWAKLLPMVEFARQSGSLETSNLLADPAPNSTKAKGRGTL